VFEIVLESVWIDLFEFTYCHENLDCSRERMKIAYNMSIITCKQFDFILSLVIERNNLYRGTDRINAYAMST